MIGQRRINVPEIAMVFAAGRGTRMLPLTRTVPKPMVEVCGKPLIDYRLDKLVEAGVRRAVVNTHHLAEIIEAHLRRRRDIEIVISREPALLDTGGGLVKALPYLGEKPFYVINNDVIWVDNGNTPALLRLAEAWKPDAMDALLLLHPVADAIGYHGGGDFELDGARIGKSENPAHPYVYTGVQILHPRILQGYGEEPFSLSTVFKDILCGEKQARGMHGLIHRGNWLHVDSQEGIRTAERFLATTVR